MTRTMDFTATIKTKRCKNTGITEQIIRELHARPGRRIMAVVELCVDDAHNKHDAPNHVDLTIESIEPAMEDYFDEHLRELSATKFQNRALATGDEALPLDGQAGRKLEDVVDEGRAHLVLMDDEDSDDDSDEDSDDETDDHGADLEASEEPDPVPA